MVKDLREISAMVLEDSDVVSKLPFLLSWSVTDPGTM